jgi:hypothetical protein
VWWRWNLVLQAMNYWAVSIAGYHAPRTLALGRVSLIKAPSLLAGVLVDARDERVTPSHAVKRADAIATTSPEP